MKTTLFRRLGGHIGKFFGQQQDGNLTSVAGWATALLLYIAPLAGVPLTPELAAAAVAAVTTAIAAGKKKDS